MQENAFMSLSAETENVLKHNKMKLLFQLFRKKNVLI